MLQKKTNPVLERIRDDTLRNEAIHKKSVEEMADDLAERLSRVHASFLFLGDQKALQKFCQHMSASPAGIMNNAWNALAVGLGFTRLQVECIRHTSREDFTYLVLKSYAIKKDAVLGHLVRELVKIQRLDAFTAVLEELKGLAAKIEENQTEDSGVDCPESEPSLHLIYPPDYKRLKENLNSQLIFTMKELEEVKNEKENGVKIVEQAVPRRKEENRVQGAAVVRRARVTPKFNVFLTFAGDGAELAKKIAKTFRTAQGNRPQIGVLILEEQRRKVEDNPENFIMHYFDKMNYIIPILTEGYMEAISCKKPQEAGIMASLDTTYAYYIKDLSNKYYMGNWCDNDKIRCVVPKDKLSILYHRHRKLDPIMKAYVYDTEIEALARRITCTYDDD